MRAPERRERKTNLLDLICELIEQPRSKIGGSILKSHDSAADCLIEIGLLRPGAVPSTIACRACDEDHAATPEFDSIARRYFHFCPIAGRVARRIISQRAFSALARAVATVPATEIGLIVTSSPLPDSQFALPNRYMVVSLRDIASVRGNRLEIDRHRVAAHIREVPRNQVRLRAGRGRSSVEELILDAFHGRRQRREPFVSIMAEARAIVSELTKTHPDRTPPGVSTARRHLCRLRSPKS
jgi:hypothetical protein